MDIRTAEAIVRDSIDLVCEHYAVVPPRISIHWDLEGPEELGTATGDHLVRLNPVYFEALGDVYVQTLLHEAAHIATVRRNLRRSHNRRLDWSPHGIEWRRAMRVLGAEIVPHATPLEMAMSRDIDWAA